MKKSRNSLAGMSHLRSDCPLACALDIVGDKWSLLIVRDMFFGKQRFSEFLESEEAITTNILTERLNRLEKAGIIERRQYQDRPPRHEYHLTSVGRELGPIIEAYLGWSRTHITGTKRPPSLKPQN